MSLHFSGSVLLLRNILLASEQTRYYLQGNYLELGIQKIWKAGKDESAQGIKMFLEGRKKNELHSERERERQRAQQQNGGKS